MCPLPLVPLFLLLESLEWLGAGRDPTYRPRERKLFPGSLPGVGTCRFFCNTPPRPKSSLSRSPMSLLPFPLCYSLTTLLFFLSAFSSVLFDSGSSFLRQGALTCPPVFFHLILSSFFPSLSKSASAARRTAFPPSNVCPPHFYDPSPLFQVLRHISHFLSAFESFIRDKIPAHIPPSFIFSFPLRSSLPFCSFCFFS